MDPVTRSPGALRVLVATRTPDLARRAASGLEPAVLTIAAESPARELFRGVDAARHELLLWVAPPGPALAAALAERDARAPDLPVVAVCAATAEELRGMVAAGLDDAVGSDALHRLPLAVDRALRDARQRRESRAAAEALRESESRYRLLFQGHPHPMFFHDADTLEILAVNDAAVESYGYSREEFLRMTLRDLWASSPEPEGAEGGVRRHRSLRGLRWQHRLKDASLIDVEVSSQALSFGGRPARVVLAQDVSARKRAERALRESERRYARAVAGANDGLWDWDLGTGQVYYSSRWKALLGYSEEEVGSSIEDWLGRVHPEDASRLRERIAAHLRDAQGYLEDEHRVRHRDGTWRWMLGRGRAVWTAEGQASRMAGSLTDISERKRAEEQLVHDAYHDALTGLPNRMLFLDRLDHAARRSHRRDGRSYAVLFLDLDRFKIVNDSLGHAVGDQLLVAVGNALQRTLRSGDTVARLGGDEFTVLLEDLPDPAVALRTAERILGELSGPFQVAGQPLSITASIGVALSGARDQSPADLMRDADIAMYRAKALGKGRYEVFDPAMHKRIVALLRLEGDLRRAIQRQEFQVHYQPIVRLRDGVLEGFEALVRWEHPRRGSIPPDEFLAVAEETGLITSIGSWVLEQACTQARQWGERFPGRAAPSVSVNLSARQLADPGLAGRVAVTLRQTGLPAANLKLEITETRLESGETAVEALRRLKEIGVRLAIDDFGTGYSSLSRLSRLPIDAVKIDRSFISGMDTAEESREIVRMIIALAGVLRLDVVAEGIETDAQLRLLQSLGCQYGQGYHLCRPCTSEAAEAFLAAPPAVPRTVC